jgi:NAD(P)-dependent dehydrogenase (short-subunit alcohol dehydrogenase family)
MPLLADKVAVITGAGSGIGRATARLFARQGARVHVVDVEPELATAAAREIRDTGGRAEAHAVDCADADQVEALARSVIATNGRVDVLVNNAGICVAGPVDRLSLDDWRRAVDVNLLGVVHGVHFFAPAMIAGEGGHIVNTSSAAGLIGFPLLGPYVATKFAVVGLSESLNAELAARGVHVSAVCPGAVRTRIFESGRFDLPGDWMTRVEGLLERRAASPEAIAREILATVEHRRGLVLSAGTAMRAVWLLKRLSPGLYRLLARALTRRALDSAGVPVSRRTW